MKLPLCNWDNWELWFVGMAFIITALIICVLRIK